MGQVQGQGVVQESVTASESKNAGLTSILEQMLSPSCANGLAEQTSSFLTGSSQFSCTAFGSCCPCQPCDWFNTTSRLLVAYL